MKVEASKVKMIHGGLMVDLPSEQAQEAMFVHTLVKDLVNSGLGSDDINTLLEHTDMITDGEHLESRVLMSPHKGDVTYYGAKVIMQLVSDEVDTKQMFDALVSTFTKSYEDEDFDESEDMDEDEAEDTYDQVVEATNDPQYEKELDEKIDKYSNGLSNWYRDNKIENEDKDRVSSGDAEHVNSPAHYQHIVLSHNGKDPQTYEAIDIIEGVLDSLNLSPFGSDCVGNTIKYILRAPYKSNTAEDLSKGAWYLSRYAERLGFNDEDLGEEERTEAIGYMLEQLIEEFLDLYSVDPEKLDIDTDFGDVEVSLHRDYDNVHTTREPERDYKKTVADTSKDDIAKMKEILNQVGKAVEDFGKTDEGRKWSSLLDDVLGSDEHGTD